MKILILTICVSMIFSCAEKKLDGKNGLPACISTMIEELKAAKNPPESVTQYNYKGQTVFYVVAGCCDQYNTVYDSDCKVLGSPEGGIEGSGDGKPVDFFKDAKDKKEVWRIE